MIPNGPDGVILIGLAIMLVAVGQAILAGKVLDGPERGAEEMVGVTVMIFLIGGLMLGAFLVLLGLWGVANGA